MLRESHRGIRRDREQHHRDDHAPARDAAVADRRPIVVEDLVGLVDLVDQQHEARFVRLVVGDEHVDSRQVTHSDRVRTVERAAQLDVEAFGLEPSGEDTGPEELYTDVRRVMGTSGDIGPRHGSRVGGPYTAQHRQ